jgi:methionyl-tRNA synthetase
MSKFYITTPIYYVNDVPHIGHAYTTIAADVMARFKRLAGYDVFFLTGTDEHGINIARVAERNGVSPQEWADRIAAEFRRLWRELAISHDDFIRTTESRHVRVAQHVFQRLYDQGDIYRGRYAGWYCASCESFYPEGDLGPGRTCPVHTGRPVEWSEEECYLFRLSRYQEWLLNHIETHPASVAPDGPRHEVLSFVRSGLKDIAVSRATFTWGVPVPFDRRHVIYVWIDALTNYISAIGYLDDPPKFQRYWPADVHLVGKEIVRFHAVIWPILLHALGLEIPRQTFAHGWLTFGGRRFSKSLGIVIDPVGLSRELAQESGIELDVAVDALRYFLLREIPFGSDGDFSKSALIHRFNADLANDYGNLLSRSLPLVDRHFGGRIPPRGPEEGGDAPLRETTMAAATSLEEHLDRLDFRRALEEIWRILSAANRYLDAEAPWREASSGRRQRAGTILHNVLEVARIATILLSPWMPRATERAWRQIGLPMPLASQRLSDALRWGGLPEGTQIRLGRPIFPRIETQSVGSGGTSGRRGSNQGAIPVVHPQRPPSLQGGKEMSLISLDEFKKVDLRVAEVVEAKPVAGADKLLEIQVKVGDSIRTIVAGIAQHYPPSALIGRKIVIVANLQPRRVRGVESEGMLLAATHGDQIALVSIDGDVPSGTPVA